MKVGFTGTRGGMTDAQRVTIARLLIRVHEAHHGDCIGADEQFHRLCRDAAVPVVIHPPINAGRRAFCSGGHVLEPEDYLPRNRAIVDSTELLIGAPFEREEPAPARGQGTWSTIRYARRQGGAVVVVWPDGSMFETAGKTPRFAGGFASCSARIGVMAKSPAPVVERLLYDPTDQPMKYLWLKYVEGVNLAEHCQKCLLGPGSRRIGTRFIAGRTRPFLFEDVPLDEYAPRVYYLCGVSDPYDLRTNFHLAFTFQPGGRIEYAAPGVSITVRDARRLPITGDHIDPAHPRARAYMWKTCRNWQFAWALKRGAYFILGPDAGPVPDQAPPIPPAPASLF